MTDRRRSRSLMETAGVPCRVSEGDIRGRRRLSAGEVRGGKRTTEGFLSEPAARHRAGVWSAAAMLPPCR